MLIISPTTHWVTATTHEGFQSAPHRIYSVNTINVSSFSAWWCLPAASGCLLYNLCRLFLFCLLSSHHLVTKRHSATSYFLLIRVCLGSWKIRENIKREALKANSAFCRQINECTNPLSHYKLCVWRGQPSFCYHFLVRSPETSPR